MRRTRLRPSFLCALLLALVLPVVAPPAAAQVRAWLDRDRIGPGETVTLNVESSGAGTPAPDFSPLQRDFVVSGNTSRREFQMRNGATQVRALHGVALRPRRDGVLTVPSLQVGSARTSPLTLVVAANANGSGIPARAGDNVFIESQPDDESPYVQQAVGWVVRLYSAVPLVSGQLEQPPPDGATLQRVGEDAQYTRDVGGRRYMVVERRFLLVPERSGTLSMPPARFDGRGAGGFFDDLFGDRGGVLAAQARPRFLQVLPPPAHAPQPWLPLHALQLRYAAAPRQLRVGQATDLVVEVTADGAMAAQMPDLALPAMTAVQVFADPVKSDESLASGRPRVKQVRRFALVPTAPGLLRVPAVEVAWWDAAAGRARTARLPPLQLDVAPATTDGAAAAAAASRGDNDAAVGAAATTGSTPSRPWLRNPWIAAAVVFAGLWLLTLLWALGRRNARPVTTSNKGGPPPVPSGGHAHVPAADAVALPRALDTGDLGDVADALHAAAPRPCTGMDGVRMQLADPGQRHAIDLLQQARWADGDGRAARAALRSAFAQGPRWRPLPDDKENTLLPPLYPPR